MEAVWVILFVLLVASVAYTYITQQKAKDSPVRVAQYKSVDEANVAISGMVKDGWTVKGIDTTDGHINVGRTATATILTGGLALFLGGSRSPGTITVLYEKTKDEQTS